MTGYWIPPEMMQRLAGSLLHFVWQGAMIALLTAVALRFLARRSADARYVVSVFALLLMLLAPIATFIFYAQAGALTLQLLRILGGVVATATTQTIQTPDTLAWTQWIVAAWFSGVFVFSFRLVAGWRLSRRLRETADPLVPQRVMDIFEGIRAKLMATKPINLLISTHIDTPAVIGWMKPAILLPISAITGLSDEQLTAVFAHELAHIRRHDFLVNVLQRGIEAVLFYHPAVWWISARVRAERENCCDDLAVQICGDRLLYAEALIELERSRDTEVPAMAVAATGSGLVHRVRRILGRETASQDWQSAVVALLFVVVWIVGGVWQTETAHAVPVRTAAILPAPPPQALQALAAIVTAQPVPIPEPEPAPVAAVQAGGRIEGVVVRAGSSQPIANAQVTLSGNAIDIQTVMDFAEQLYEVAKVPPDNVFNQTRLSINEHLQRTQGLTGQALTEAIQKTMNAGVVPASPANAILEDRILQGAINIGKNLGMSPYNSDFSAVLRSGRSSLSTFKATTDRSGRFILQNVPAGSYVVRVERNGYFGAPGAAPLQTASTNVTVGNSTANVTVSMRPGATISGRLRDEAGLPMTNATVQAFTVDYNNGVPALRAAADNKTDDRGQYNLFWLPPGDYIIAYTHPTTSVVGAQSALQQVIGMFYPGTPSVTNAIPVSVKIGDNIEGIDFSNRNVKPVKISGSVSTTLPPPQANAAAAGGRAAPAPVRSAVLMLLQRDTTLPDDVGARQVGTVVMGTVGAKGDFEISVAPGAYDLYARIPTPGGVIGNTFGRTPIDVRDDAIKGVNIDVHAAVPGGGTVTVNGAAPGQSSIKVLLRSDDSGAKLPAYAQNLMQRVQPVNAEGNFSFPVLFVGHYSVAVEGLGPGMYVADVRQGAASVIDSGIQVTAEPPQPLQVVIKTDSGTLQGTVLDFEKRPATDTTVVIVPPENRRQNRLLYWTATTDASGKFTIQGIAPGNYKVFAWPNLPPGIQFNPKFITKYEASGRSISVGPSATLNADLTAIPID
jgi:beta-lactamase regulating signal transducer with metallopeptidase domain